MRKKLLLIIAAGAIAIAACTSQADTVSQNISVAAEQFEIERRIVFLNGITDKYLLSIEGRCSIEVGNTGVANALEVTCRTGGPTDEAPDGLFVKHFLGLSDNVSFFVEQLTAVNVDPFHYRVVFRPEEIIPDIDVDTSG